MTISADRLTTEEILRLNRDYAFFSWSARAKISPIVIDRAEGIYFWDPDGKRYIDFNSQLLSVNIGHGDRRVADAIAEQAHRLAFAAPQFATEARGRLVCMSIRNGLRPILGAAVRRHRGSASPAGRAWRGRTSGA
jgi:taurine--2-oxoglutarate transaminase